jgi:hypothetical protein
VAKYGSVATHNIISVYCRPRSALTAYVLSYVFMQLCSHTASVVEQVANPLARQQLCAQAWANVVIGVVDVPQAPPVAPVPPVPPVGPVVLPLPQAKTQEATPNTRTSDPTLFNMLSLTEIQASPSRHSPQEAFPGGFSEDHEHDREVSNLRKSDQLQLPMPTARRGRALRWRLGHRLRRCFPRPSECRVHCEANRPPPRPGHQQGSRSLPLPSGCR